MRRSLFRGSVLAGVGAIICGCPHGRTGVIAASSEKARLERLLAEVRQKEAPDPHLRIFEVGVEPSGHHWALTGEVSMVESKAAALAAVRPFASGIEDQIIVLPTAELGEKSRGLVCLSVATGHELPDHKAEMGAQLLMGQAVRVLKEHRGWVRVQCPDGYLVWAERGALVRCNGGEVEKWQNSPLSIVTVFEDVVRAEPSTAAQPVADVVLGDLVKVVEQREPWLGVELPDGRKGFLPAGSAQDFRRWRAGRHASPQNIEQTARTLLGRPYLWGGNSPRGLDCSGFTKLVFFLNGIELMRNAAEQALQGKAVPLDPQFSHLKKGDLLFFGWDGPRPRMAGQSAQARNPTRPGIFHVAIYLGDKLFIQSSGSVRISSLDPESELYDERHARALTSARRLLAD